MISLNLYTSSGLLVAAGVTDFISIDLQRNENQVGAFELILPGYYADFGFAADYIVEVYREDANGRMFLDGETCWFVRRIQQCSSQGVCESLTLGGHDTTGLLLRRIVAWLATDSPPEGFNDEGYKSVPADEAIRAVFRENFTTQVGGVVQSPLPSVVDPVESPFSGYSLTTANRVMAQTPLGMFGDEQFIQPKAPVVVQSIAFQTALAAMQALADASAQLGTRVVFDVLYSPGERGFLGDFEFRVWSPRRGRVRLDLLFGDIFGTVGDACFTQDFTEEATWIHAAGSGAGDARIIVGVADPVASRRSPFYPIEAFLDLGQNETNAEAELVGAAQAELYVRRAKISLTGSLIQNPGYILGVDYRYGDVVLAQSHGVQFKSRVSSYHIHVDASGVTIDVPFESDPTL